MKNKTSSKDCWIELSSNATDAPAVTVQIIPVGYFDTKESVAKIEKRVQKKWEKTKEEKEAEAAGVNMAGKPENTEWRETVKRFLAMRQQLGRIPTPENFEAVQSKARTVTDNKELADLQLEFDEIVAASEAHQTIREVLRMAIKSVDKLTGKEKEVHAKELLAMKRLAVSQCENVKKIRGQMLAIPLVDSALKSKYGYLQRDEVEDRKNFTRTIQELNKTPSTTRTVGEWEACPELAPYKRKYPGRDTLRGWIKEAGIELNSGGRPKKKQ